MTPTQELRHEHDVILLVLKGAEKRAALPAPNPGEMKEMIDFFMNFVDRCHHTKEEKHLFPKLEERGIPHHGGPIVVMLDEHDQGRILIAAMKEELEADRGPDRQIIEDLKENLLQYVRLLRAHIDKENNVLFMMAERVLTQEDQQELTAAFAKVEAEEIGEGVHEKYHQMAHRLAGG